MNYHQNLEIATKGTDMRFFINTIIASSILLGSFSSEVLAQSLPENSHKDNCYAIAFSPNTYDVTTTKILVKAAYTKIVEVPPAFEIVKEKVLIQEEQPKELSIGTERHYDLDNTKASTSNVKPKTRSLMNFIPASTTGCNDGCDEEETMESTSQYIEKLSDSDMLKIKANKLLEREKYESTIAFGEKTEIDTKGEQANIAPVTTEKYKIIEREVMVKPATTMEVEVPAEYKIVEERTLLEEGGEKLWITVLCPSKIDDIVISQLQLALKSRDYYKGEINGQLNEATRAALKTYQQHKTLPVGQLDYKTLEHLGFKTSSL